jgi:hypothetical protein
LVTARGEQQAADPAARPAPTTMPRCRALPDKRPLQI